MQPKRAGKRRINYFRLMLVVIITLAVAGGIVYAGIQIFKTASPVSAGKLLPFGASSPHVYTGAGFLYYKDGKLGYIDDLDEKKNYTLPVASDEVNLAGGQNIAAVYNAKSMQIVNAPNKSDFSGTLVSLKSGNDHVAALHKSVTDMYSILIFDSTGAQKDELIFNTQYLVGYGFYSTSTDAFWTLEVDVSGFVPSSTVKTYSLETLSTTGVLPIQDQLVDQLVMTDTSIFVSGTNSLIRYSRNANSESYRILTYGYELADSSFSGTTGAFLFTPRKGAGALDIVRVLTCQEGDQSGEKEYDVALPKGTIRAFLSGSSIIAVTKDAINVVSYKGEVTKAIELSTPADDAYNIKDGRVMVKSGDALYIIAVE